MKWIFHFFSSQVPPVKTPIIERPLRLQVPPDFEAFLNSIDWSQFEDGYGNSACIYDLPMNDLGIPSLPTLLRNLCSEDDDTRQDAVNDGIWGRICHQHTLYSASPFAGKALLILLKTRSVVDLPGNTEAIAEDILRCLNWMWKCYTFNPDDRDFQYFSKAVEDHLETIESYHAHGVLRVRQEAETLSRSFREFHLPSP